MILIFVNVLIEVMVDGVSFCVIDLDIEIVYCIMV